MTERAQRKRSAYDEAVDALHGRCNIYTKPEIAEVLLDESGWVADADLGQARLLEPAVGDGALLVEAVRRLLAWSQKNRCRITYASWKGRILTFELEPRAADLCRRAVCRELSNHGVGVDLAGRLSRAWVINGDFLLRKRIGRFTHVVANPPYVRAVNIPEPIATMYTRAGIPRADLSMVFLWRACQLLQPGGRAAFLTSDRWLLAEHGGSLRDAVLREHRLRTHIRLTANLAFQRVVGAYPAISVLEKPQRLSQDLTMSATPFSETVVDIRQLRKALANESSSNPSEIERKSRIFSSSNVAEERGARASIRVRVGTALGLKAAFVVGSDVDIERDRLLPFVDTAEVESGRVRDATKWVVNPWDTDGRLVDLRKYPKMARHLRGFKAGLAIRACVKGRPEQWYRTIDIINAGRVAAAKVVIAGLSKAPRLAVHVGGAVLSNGLYYIACDSTYEAEALMGKLGLALADLKPPAAHELSGAYLRYTTGPIRKALEHIDQSTF